jgi:hypothetical protein
MLIYALPSYILNPTLNASSDHKRDINTGNLMNARLN